MTDTTKTDLSQLERDCDKALSIGAVSIAVKPTNLRALLDAKEAAERERDDWHRYHYTASNQLTEARASAAAAWEAGRDAAADCAWETWNDAPAEASPDHQANAIRNLTNPDPSANEALRRVKEAVWDEGYAKGYEAGTDHWPRPNNPYAAKEAAHG